MKYSLTALSMAALAVAKPAFLNTAFDVQEGQPFTLEFSGCESGCTITLQHGPNENLLDFKPLTGDATGGSFTFTLDNVPSDTYAFKIENNETGEDNWSQQFEYEGEGKPIPTVTVTKTAEPESTTSTTTSSEPTTTTTKKTTTEEETSTMTTPSSSPEKPSNTRTSDPSPTDDDDEEDEEDDNENAQTTDIPDPDGDNDDAAGSLGAPITLVLAAVAGLLVLH